MVAGAVVSVPDGPAAAADGFSAVASNARRRARSMRMSRATTSARPSSTIAASQGMPRAGGPSLGSVWCRLRLAGIGQGDDGCVFLVTGLERDLRHRWKLAWSLERDQVLVIQRGGQVSEGLHDVLGIGRHNEAARLLDDGWPEGICARSV